MAEPRTEAGRRLLALLHAADRGPLADTLAVDWEGSIFLIEAEAADAARRASDAQVAGMRLLRAEIAALPSEKHRLFDRAISLFGALDAIDRAINTAIAATPAPQPATPLPSDLRDAITRYLAFDGSTGMFDAMALGDARGDLRRLIPLGDVTDVQNRWYARLAEQAAPETGR